jgi:hypothetical protein
MTARLAMNVKKSTPLQIQGVADPAEMENDTDDIAWATRSNMWQSRVEKVSARRTKRAKPQPALILAGHGVSLRIANGALTIQNGFTHYPQKREIIRYFPGDLSLPERIIVLDGSGRFPLMFYHGSPSEKSALFALIGRAILSASQVRRVIQPILIACAGNWKPAKILSREINIAAR